MSLFDCFRYTIVRVQAEYWVKLQSDPITFQSSSVTPVDTGSPSQSPSNTSSQSPSSTQSTQSSTENQTSLPNIVGTPDTNDECLVTIL